MTEPIIKVHKLGKKYRIGAKINPEGLDNFRDVILNTVKAPFRNLKRLRKLTYFEDGGDGEASDIIWALKDVSFEVNKGEVVGIIGRNGSGKSTLLKILSRITEPTKGCAELRGRVASLLEVGTGFHRELTGRENIYLNGSILGMKKWEINKKFDEIVAFSEIEKFIDTPVKHYSSGMYVRLAFAVAAHLNPEILLVDEVLAVGDTAFQKKCLGKMGDIAKAGRTVLFVSHSMDSVLRLCTKAILLNNGQIQYADKAEKVVSFYLQGQVSSLPMKQWDLSKAPGNEIVRLLEVFAHDEEGVVKKNFKISMPIGVTMKYEVLKSGNLLTPAFTFFNSVGVNIFDSHDTTVDWRTTPKQAGMYRSTVWIPGNFLNEGVILVGVAIIQADPFVIHLHEKDVVAFNVVDYFGKVSARGEYVGSFPGAIRPLLKWDLKRDSN